MRPFLTVILGVPWTGGSTITMLLTANQQTTRKSLITSIPRSLFTLVAASRCAEVVSQQFSTQQVLVSRWTLELACQTIARVWLLPSCQRTMPTQLARLIHRSVDLWTWSPSMSERFHFHPFTPTYASGVRVF